MPEFEAANDAELDVTFVPWEDVSTRLNTGFAGGTAPDVFGHGPAAAAGLAESDRLEPLDGFIELLEPSDLEDLAAFLVGGQVNGSQYMVPLGGEGRLIAYRKDLFADAGLDPDDPPSTWNDAYDAAVELTSGDTAGLILQTGEIQRVQSFMGLLGSEGGQLLSDDGAEVTWNSDAGVRALEYFVRLHQGDPAVSDLLGADFANQPAAQNPLATGSAAMVMVTSGQAVQIARARPELTDQIALIQPMSSAEAEMFGGPGPGLFMNKDSGNKELAWAFMEFMLSADVSESYAQVTGQIPVRASAKDGDYVADEPLIASFIEAGPNFVGSPNVPAWVEVRNVIDQHLERALHAEVSPREALDDAAAEAGPLLSGE